MSDFLANLVARGAGLTLDVPVPSSAEPPRVLLEEPDPSTGQPRQSETSGALPLPDPVLAPPIAAVPRAVHDQPSAMVPHSPTPSTLAGGRETVIVQRRADPSASAGAAIAPASPLPTAVSAVFPSRAEAPAFHASPLHRADPVAPRVGTQPLVQAAPPPIPLREQAVASESVRTKIVDHAVRQTVEVVPAPSSLEVPLREYVLPRPTTELAPAVPTRLPAPAPEYPRRESGPAPVQVRIGSIEIRATPPEPPSPVRAAATRAPAAPVGFSEFARLRRYRAWGR